MLNQLFLTFGVLANSFARKWSWPPCSKSLVKFFLLYFLNMLDIWTACNSLYPIRRGGASSRSQGGPKAQFCPTFKKIRVLLHFYVTIFLDSQCQGGPRPSWTPWIRGPWFLCITTRLYFDANTLVFRNLGGTT